MLTREQLSEHRMLGMVGVEFMAQRTAYSEAGKLQYAGFAAAGADAAWAIKKAVYDGGGRLAVTLWAGGSSDCDKVWANRESLVYS